MNIVPVLFEYLKETQERIFNPKWWEIREFILKDIFEIFFICEDFFDQYE